MNNLVTLFFIMSALSMHDATCAASSSAPSTPENLTIINPWHFMATIMADELADTLEDNETVTYSRTLGMLVNHIQPEKELVVVHDVESPSMRHRGEYNCREERLSPLLYTLYRSCYHTTLAIAKAFPASIDTTDSRGNTAMHYLCAGADCKCATCLVPPAILELLAHQLNTPNNKGIRPIFTVMNAHMLPILYLRGAQLDEEAIARVRPQYWRNSNILGTLHSLGFRSEFLAKTFDYDEAAIVRAQKQIAPYMKERLHLEAIRSRIKQFDSLSDIQILTMREPFGRAAKDELRRREHLAQTGRAISDELRERTMLKQKKRERSDEQSADGTKFMRTL